MNKVKAISIFLPTMGTEAVMQQMLSNNAKVNEVGHVMAVWPRIQFGAANSDTPYALATIDLEGRVVHSTISRRWRRRQGALVGQSR